MYPFWIFSLAENCIVVLVLVFDSPIANPQSGSLAENIPEKVAVKFKMHTDLNTNE